jgi:hypothetical protein
VKRGRTRKLFRPWQGPYTIVKKVSDVAYRIYTTIRKWPEEAGGTFNCLKPYSASPQPDNQEEQQTALTNLGMKGPGVALPESERAYPVASELQVDRIRDATSEMYDDDADTGEEPLETGSSPILFPLSPAVHLPVEETVTPPDDVTTPSACYMQ